MFFYINDIITAHHPNNQNVYNIFTKKLNKQFKLIKREPLFIFLNIRLIRDKKNWLY